ncbi:MAG: dihydrolipoamide acetyltransferase family protein [Bacillota bacterium]
MAVEIKMPKMGLSMTTGVVGGWMKKEGEPVAKGENIVEVTTEKIVNSVECPIDGVLLKIIAQEGDELPIGGLMGLVGDASEMGSVSVPAQAEAQAAPAQAEAQAPAAAPAQVEAKAPAGKVKITPVAAKMAKENGLDVSLITGTGPNGRITKEDIEAALAAPPAPAPEPAAAPAAAADYEVVPYAGMVKAVGDNMLKSWTTSPRVTQCVRVDVSELLALRKKINSSIDESDKVSITDMLLKITASALELHPEINVSLQGNEIRRYKDIHLGFAVALENGLIVPVIRNANKLSVLQIGREAKRLAGLARENKLSVKDFTGGTFTLTNVGAQGSVDFFTPIINQPEAAILGIGRTVEMPVVVDGNIVIRPMMGLSFTYDHRILNGTPAAKFAATLMALIQNPLKAIL